MNQLEVLELRVVTLHYKTSSFTSINFKRVKKLVLTISGTQTYHCPCPLVFDALEELEISSDSFFEPWIFFARSNDLKKLKLKLFWRNLNGRHLSRISSTWPNLIEVSMDMCNLVDVPFNEISEFIRSLTNLQRFNALDESLSFYLIREKIADLKWDLRDQFKELIFFN